MENEVFTKLNEAQRRAVEKTDGSMLIIAGAGTGKTRVITSRILHLLIDKKVPASEILALTFTEKATDEMISRVDESMPLSYEEVTIKTFHGFCDSILRERGMEIGIDPGFRLLTRADQWLFLKKNLFSLELDYYRPLGNPSKFIHTLLNHFSRLKDEDVLPELYVGHGKNMMEEALDDPAKEEAVKMLEVAKAYAAYQKLMIESNYLDFGDLQYYALQLFDKRPSVLKEFRERFKYILVDEFQDTNYAQNKLVMMLADGHQNITVVGDDDQSIYKWRGASLSNIRSFEKRFPSVERVVLTENYRSTQNILDVSYSVVQNNNPDRLEHESKIDKRLIARAFNEPGETVKVLHFSNYVDEVRCTVDSISDLVKGGSSYGDIAILVRANQHAAPFTDALKVAGIPFSVRDTQGLMRFEEIKDMVALLRFLAKPQDDVAFFRLLSLPLFKIPMNEVLEVVDKARKSDFEPMFYYLKNFLKKEAENMQNALPGMEDESPFVSVYELFDSLLNFSRGNGVYRIIGEFLDKSGYVKELTAVDSWENGEKIQHISDFLELVRDFDADADQNPLRAFLDYLDSMQQALGAIPSTSEPDKDAVAVLTVHSAKGLEFDYVFVPSLVNHRFPSIRRSDPISIPSVLISEDLPESDMHMQEERRLFYVACTRAKKGMYLSYSDTYEGRKKWKVSPFVLEVLESEKASEIDHTKEVSDELVREHGSLKKEVKNESEFVQKISSIPEVNLWQLSYSKVDTFKNCPLKYKFRYYFKIPTPQPHAANFGSSVHNAVNKFYEEIKAGTVPSLDRLSELYDMHWISAGYESKGHENTRKKRGWEIMERFYSNEEAAYFKIPAFLEKAFRLKIGGIIFTGRIDRIDKLEDGTYEVVDYKTGASKKGVNLKKDMQLSLYALACKEVFRLPVSALSLYYLEDGSKASTVRSDEDLVAVKEEIAEVVKDLRASDLSPTPGFHCGFCEYRVLCHAAA